MKDKDILVSIVSKRDNVLIKFKSMQDILNEQNAWFDGYGNLCVATDFTNKKQLAPSYFPYLGKTCKFVSGHSLPDWCIENEWQDLFRPNMALRAIASGKLSKEDMIEIANKNVLVK